MRSRDRCAFEERGGAGFELDALGQCGDAVGAEPGPVVVGVLVDDDDGCPDEALARVDVERREIVILDKVYFDYDRASLQGASTPVLEAVLQVLRAYPDIAKVEIQGHTDSRGDAAYNLRLSQARVESVLEWLVARGIARERLVARGYGESQPIVADAHAEAEHATNRRVQFAILELGGEPVAP